MSYRYIKNIDDWRFFMKYKNVPYLILFAVGGLSVESNGQELDLFQATDNAETARANSRTPQQRNSAASTEPYFTLVGTSRFGDKYFGSLLTKDRETLVVEWTPGKVTLIDGHRNFGIADIGSRSVSVKHPDSDPCVENTDKGVSCNGNIALLTLSNAKPLEARQRAVESSINVNTTTEEGEAIEVELNENGEPLTIGNTGVLTRNPFTGQLQSAPELTPEELAAREERRQRRAEQFRDFEIVRIGDDEIPEGMQRIRSPFGDRLEPAED